MQQLTPSHTLHQHFPHALHFSLLRSSKTHQDTQQLHAFSLKTGIFSHPSISSRLLSLYADPDINNLRYARSVFDQIQLPTLVLWNIIIKCYVENQQSYEAISLFAQLLHHFPPDEFTFPCVIKGCAKLNAVNEGKQIHGLVLKLGFGLDKFTQGSLVNLYSKCGEIGCAHKVFDEMGEKDLVLWNSLLDGYARCGEVCIAMKVFEEMPERDFFSWTVLIDGLAKCGEVETAREIFEKMPNRNLVSWNTMINGYMKAGDINSACKLFNRMPKRNLITWNSIIGGFESNLHFVEAWEVFKRMLKEEFRPSHATLVSIISAVSGLASLGKGRSIHSYIVKNGIELDGVVGTVLIEMYSKCGSIDSALTVFRTISNKKLGHWTAIIVGLSIHGMAEHALEIFLEMCRIGVKPNAITFVGVLNACSHAGLINDGRGYFNTMINEYGIKPTIEHYGCLVDILCRAGYLEEAKNIIEGMPRRANKVIWMTLLSGARNHGNTKIAEYAAHHLIELAPETVGGYVVLSNMYAIAGEWDKVSKVREMMKKRGLRKDPGCSSIEHRGVVHEFVVGDKSHPQTKELYSKLSEMAEKLKLAGHIPDTSQVLLYIEEEEEKESELEKHSERLAIAFGLINVEAGSPICIMKNLRVCNDCHSVTKLLSKIYSREIIVRDNNRFHHFKNGLCSCKDFW
ncbi:pentatricopeptide repeat-containing protein At1g08070, chloroplastic-like [Herrania umbratica]|uniref:Pentatricopeptide repeat-containing protein At1g08070, chloroplastic-like n=1 Tax=Herrania umbratica TaxID=108875 RepID=A0A6J0ZHM3_9ROSI|nr:pentatricopeptide repeat-containing protein At1g08070, chloroplastic-like [Herrania umbratica]